MYQREIEAIEHLQQLLRWFAVIAAGVALFVFGLL